MTYIYKAPKKESNYKQNQALSKKLVYNTTRWMNLRRLKAINTPLCEMCAEDGRVALVEEVHHIIPFLKGNDIEQIRTLAFDYENLMSLCSECHTKIHKKIKNNN